MIRRAFGALLFLLSSCTAYSQCASYPYTLSHGTTADASQVMANFSHILNCASGGPPTRQVLTGSGTYKTPSGTRTLLIRMKGGGASGGGAGTTASSPGGSTPGNNTTFNAVVAAGGGAGGSGSSGEGGKSTPDAHFRIAGAPGQFQTTLATAADSYWLTGGTGGGQGGGKSALGSTGYSGVAGSGGGGAGGSVTAVQSGANLATYTYYGGGGEGEYVEIMINSPASSYSYAIGASVSGGSAGTTGTAGGAGAAGFIVVVEYY